MKLQIAKALLPPMGATLGASLYNFTTCTFQEHLPTPLLPYCSLVMTEEIRAREIKQENLIDEQ